VFDFSEWGAVVKQSCVTGTLDGHCEVFDDSDQFCKLRIVPQLDNKHDLVLAHLPKIGLRNGDFAVCRIERGASVSVDVVSSRTTCSNIVGERVEHLSCRRLVSPNDEGHVIDRLNIELESKALISIHGQQELNLGNGGLDRNLVDDGAQTNLVVARVGWRACVHNQFWGKFMVLEGQPGRQVRLWHIVDRHQVGLKEVTLRRCERKGERQIQNGVGRDLVAFVGDQKSRVQANFTGRLDDQPESLSGDPRRRCRIRVA